MNRQRRKDVEKAIALLVEAREIIEGVQMEEQEALEGMPESLQQSDRGQSMEAFVLTFENAVDTLNNLENDLQETVEPIP